MSKEKEDINRIKVVWIEQKRTHKWPAELPGGGSATVSKGCTNSALPGGDTRLSRVKAKFTHESPGVASVDSA